MPCLITRELAARLDREGFHHRPPRTFFYEFLFAARLIEDLFKFLLRLHLLSSLELSPKLSSSLLPVVNLILNREMIKRKLHESKEPD